MQDVLPYILHADQRDLLLALRQLLFKAIPTATEKLTYQIPFFYYEGRLAYLNPTKAGVLLGFCRGCEMQDPFGVLETNGRKQVRSLSFAPKADLDPMLLTTLFIEAARVNEWHATLRSYPRASFKPSNRS